MTTFTTHTRETVAADGSEVLDAVEKAYGFIPNLIGNMIEAPATARGYLALGELFAQTSFSAAEQHVVYLTVSRVNECGYCVSAHSQIAQAAGVPKEVIESIREDEAIADPKLEALRRFTTRMIEQRGWLDEAEIGEFLAAGYTRRNVLEVVLGLAMKTISNYTNHITGTELDEAFGAYPWRKSP